MMGALPKLCLLLARLFVYKAIVAETIRLRKLTSGQGIHAVHFTS
jgi:hypothetical protein